MQIVFNSILALTFMLLQHSANSQANLKLEQSTHKFPKTQEGIVVTHKFNFINNGNAALIINDYKVSCPCTKIDFPKTPILPGESGTIFLTFDTKGKVAWQDRTVEIYHNGNKSPERIRFKIMVINE